MPPADKYVATVEFWVRYAETDAQGVVNHAHYLSWLEEGRSHFGRTVGINYAEFERSGYFLSVLEVNAQYRAPARFGDRVTIHVWTLEVKSRTLRFGYEVTNAETGQLLMTAETKHICITHQGQIAQIPTEWREPLMR